MNKIIICLALLCLMLQGCTTEQEHNKINDVEFILDCYKLNTMEKRCDCFNGDILSIKVPSGFNKYCVVEDGFIDVRNDPQLNT